MSHTRQRLGEQPGVLGERGKCKLRKGVLTMRLDAIRSDRKMKAGESVSVPLGTGMLVDRQFRLAMRRLAAAVSVITSAHKGVWCGMAATSVTSLSMDPPSLLVCINRSASLRPVLSKGRHFAINLLARQHEQICAAFGGAESGLERFRNGHWSESQFGVPILADAIAVVECVVDAEIEYGTHTIIVGRVTSTGLSEDDQPLVYCNGGYQ